MTLILGRVNLIRLNCKSIARERVLSESSPFIIGFSVEVASLTILIGFLNRRVNSYLSRNKGRQVNSQSTMHCFTPLCYFK